MDRCDVAITPAGRIARDRIAQAGGFGKAAAAAAIVAKAIRRRPQTL